MHGAPLTHRGTGGCSLAVDPGGVQVWMLVAAAVLVAWATFGLLTA